MWYKAPWHTMCAHVLGRLCVSVCPVQLVCVLVWMDVLCECRRSVFICA